MKLKNWWEVDILLLQSVSRDLQKLLFQIINIKNSIESLEAESLHELLIQLPLSEWSMFSGIRKKTGRIESDPRDMEVVWVNFLKINQN